MLRVRLSSAWNKVQRAFVYIQKPIIKKLYLWYLDTHTLINRWRIIWQKCQARWISKWARRIASPNSSKGIQEANTEEASSSSSGILTPWCDSPDRCCRRSRCRCCSRRTGSARYHLCFRCYRRDDETTAAVKGWQPEVSPSSARRSAAATTGSPDSPGSCAPRTCTAGSSCPARDCPSNTWWWWWWCWDLIIAQIEPLSREA